MTGLLNRLERKFGRFAIPHITVYIVIGQTFLYLYWMIPGARGLPVDLIPAYVLEGEVWRLVTFIFSPPATQWYWFAFVIYFLYFMGNALEGHWGTFKYNLFLLAGWALTVAAAFVTPGAVAHNEFIGGSIFLAFAYLYPDFVIYMFFILPVKIRWLALLTWAWYAFTFFTAGPLGHPLAVSVRLGIIAAVGNYLMFFGRDIVLDIKQGRRRMQTQVQRAKADAGLEEPRHRCLACGKDSNKYPQLDFRYCSQCAGDCCYCEEHIRNHEHRVTPPA